MRRFHPVARIFAMRSTFKEMFGNIHLVLKGNKQENNVWRECLKTSFKCGTDALTSQCFMLVMIMTMNHSMISDHRCLGLSKIVLLTLVSNSKWQPVIEIVSDRDHNIFPQCKRHIVLLSIQLWHQGDHVFPVCFFTFVQLWHLGDHSAREQLSGCLAEARNRYAGNRSFGVLCTDTFTQM